MFPGVTVAAQQLDILGVVSSGYSCPGVAGLRLVVRLRLHGGVFEHTATASLVLLSSGRLSLGFLTLRAGLAHLAPIYARTLTASDLTALHTRAAARCADGAITVGTVLKAAAPAPRPGTRGLASREIRKAKRGY